MPYAISNIAKIISGEAALRYDSNIFIRQLLIDSRSKFSDTPENILFFAIKGERNNGHNFVQELFERGIKNFVISEPSPDIPANFISVSDTTTALQNLAAYHRKQFKIPVIGITGSNGKTIVKEWLHQLLSPEKNIVRSPKSYNSQIGVPLSVWQMNEHHQLGIFEAGISQPGEMKNLEKIIHPTIGIITNTGDAHDAGFENRLQKANEKLQLFNNAETVFYCSDYEEIELAVANLQSVKKIAWSRKKGAGLKITSVDKSENKTQIEVVLNSTFNIQHSTFIIPFTDDASIENAIFCWLVMLHMGYENSEICGRLLSLMPVAMRLEQKEGINNCTIVNDSYNSDIGSLAIALDFLNRQNQHNKKTLILSDILQSGKNDEQLYSEVAQIVNNNEVNRIIGIGKSISQQFTKFEIPEKKFFYNTEAFLIEFNSFDFSNEAILLKGARVFEFEKINARLQKKSHETVLEIHLSALAHNLNFFRSRIAPSTKIMAMVKAFSYGSGSHEIANLLQFHRADYLAVAYSDEGVELRSAGITLPIMVMNPEKESFDSLLKFRLEPEIYNFHLLHEILDFLNQNNLAGEFPVHLKIDTGMHRLGFEENEIPLLISVLKKEKNISIKSIFSHLAASEDETQDEFTHSQIQKFTIVADKICRTMEWEKQPLRHILNSSGTLRFPDAQMDMVRLGIGLYGISAGEKEQKNLQPVAALKTTISQIKKIKKGESIGYNRNAIAERELIIATVPIGYADGLNRRLGNENGKMMVKGKFAPVIGNICMDMCMIDVTAINATEGDEVIVFGNEYSISEVAKDAGTIPYEILTSISRRVKRVYFQE